MNFQSRWKGYCLAAILLVALLSTAARPMVTAVPARKLSGVMPEFGDVQEFRISLDGQYVVYLADQTIDEVSDLYSVPLSGGVPVRIDSGVVDFAITPDSQTLVYSRAVATVTKVLYTMFRVPLAGPGDQKQVLVEDFGQGGYFQYLQFTPDSQHLVFVGPSEDLSFWQLQSLSLVDSHEPSVRFPGPFALYSSDEDRYEISSDSRWVVYQSRSQGEGLPASLFLASVAGPVDQVVMLEESIFGLQVSADHQWLVYKTDQDHNGSYEVHSRPFQMSGETNYLCESDLYPETISPDSQWVICGNRSLVPMEGPASAVIPFDTAWLPAGYLPDGVKVTFSPDSQWLIYTISPWCSGPACTNNSLSVYAAPLQFPLVTPHKLNLVDENATSHYYEVTPDSRYLLYAVQSTHTLYRVPLDGTSSQSQIVYSGEADGSNFKSPAFTSDGQKLVTSIGNFTAFPPTSHIYQTPMEFTQWQIISTSHLPDHRVGEYLILPNNLQVVYSGALDQSDVYELYVASIADYAVYLPNIQSR